MRLACYAWSGLGEGRRYPEADRVCSEPVRVNGWNIPDWLEREVKERDRTCVYCGVRMIERMPRRGPRRSVATWEHIVNDASIVTRENIARCCVACNSSKGTKKLADWLGSSYCKKHGITKDSVAPVVRAALERGTEADT